MSEIDFSKMNIPQLNLDYANNMINSIQRNTERNLQAVQEARDAREAEEQRRHDELIAALKEAAEKGATIVIGDNANGIQIQQNSAGAQQSMTNSQGLDYDKVAGVLKEISSYFEYPQFEQTFGDNSDNIKAVIESTLTAVDNREEEGLIKKSLKILKDLVIGAGGSLIGSGILALLGTITF